MPKKMASHLLSALANQVDRDEWGKGAEEETIDPRLRELVLQAEDLEATARALLRIARMHQTQAAK